MNDNESKASSVRTIDKAVTILETIAGSDGDIDLASLSKKLRFPKSTILRILNTLKDHNYVTQQTQTKRFSLGPALIILGKTAEKKFDIITQVHPVLVEISEKTGETTSLAIRTGTKAVYIDQVISKNMIRGQPSIGDRLELYCSASGKVLLSSLSDEQIEKFIQKEPRIKKTQKTLVEKEALQKELIRVREQGFAVDDEEVEIGGRCIAAPLFDSAGRVIAAVSVMGPTVRLRQKDIPKIAELVRDEVHKASQALGYQSL